MSAEELGPLLLGQFQGGTVAEVREAGRFRALVALPSQLGERVRIFGGLADIWPSAEVVEVTIAHSASVVGLPRLVDEEEHAERRALVVRAAARAGGLRPLARCLGFSSTTISRWHSGRENVTARVVPRLRQLCGEPTSIDLGLLPAWPDLSEVALLGVRSLLRHGAGVCARLGCDAERLMLILTGWEEASVRELAVLRELGNEDE